MLRSDPAGSKGAVDRPRGAEDEAEPAGYVAGHNASLHSAGMTGDPLGPTGDHHLMDVAADQDLAMAVGGRHRIFGAAIAHQQLRADATRLLLTGVVRRRWQAVERLQISHQPFTDRLPTTAQPIPKPTATTLEKLLVQGGQRDRPRHRHQ